MAEKNTKEAGSCDIVCYRTAKIMLRQGPHPALRVAHRGHQLSLIKVARQRRWPKLDVRET